VGFQKKKFAPSTPRTFRPNNLRVYTFNYLFLAAQKKIRPDGDAMGDLGVEMADFSPFSFKKNDAQVFGRVVHSKSETLAIIRQNGILGDGSGRFP
jgi:hypothetical protein